MDMQMNESITLKRDCTAVLIPSGERISLKEGIPVRITQALGGDYTVFVDGNLVKISGADGDALGKEPTGLKKNPNADDNIVANEQQVWEQLKTCFDPEIPVNIVDLGLVYSLDLMPLPKGGTQVIIKMTLTAPGCGMGPSIASDAEYKVLQVPGVKEARVELVWEPMWNKEMITEEGKLQLGIL